LKTTVENDVRDPVKRALEEDSAGHDVTTKTLIDPGWRGRGLFLMKAKGVLAGLPVAEAVFREVDPGLRFISMAEDGAPVRRGKIVASVEGSIVSILAGERVALNFLQRLSGIATLTARYVAAVAATRAQILDTRKTTPGMRLLEKQAVAAGGGRNHRMHLGDAILIKDNHIAALRARGATLRAVIERARAASALSLEVEVTSVEEAREAVAAGADMLLLDNMGPDEMRDAVTVVAGRCKTEASGGITLRTVRAVAETGVDYISVGALTHSVKALDISLEVDG
jgi:nicotinate-nucleotide pyrophosphorylase (carboxylating)